MPAAATLEERLAARTFLDDEGIHATLGASFGAAAFPVDGRTAVALLHLADERMYASKRARKLARDDVATRPPP